MIIIEELIERLMPFIIMPLVLKTISIIYREILNIMRGNTNTKITKKNTAEEQEKNTAEEQEKELNIDKDLKKYFNYKE